MNQIHDNLAPIELVFFSIFDWLIVFVLFLIALFLFWKYIYNSKISEIKIVKQKNEKVFIPKSFSLKKEIKKLEKLKAKQEWKMFSVYSTKILKKILEKKFNKAFAFATGKELKEILEEKNQESELKNIHEFFKLVYPIKFAKANGKDEIAEKILEILKNYK